MTRLIVLLYLLFPSGLSSQLVGPSAPAGLSRGDWEGIRHAYEAGRHQIFAVDAVHRARNPAQQWTTWFDGRGSLIKPDHMEWTWGLELKTVSRAGQELWLAESPGVSVDADSLTYSWSSTVDEWYRNKTGSLKHGLTLHERPEGSAGRLAIDFAVRGELLPRAVSAARAVQFVDFTGAEQLAYANLRVFDATGRTVAAGFAVVGDCLRLWIDDREAVYPVTVDPDATQVLLKPSNTAVLFGWDVDVSGDTVVISSPYEASASPGVNGDQSDTSAYGAGAVYVFQRLGVLWIQQAYIKASNPEANDLFGWSIALDGNRLVVGAPREDSEATGVDGDEGNAVGDIDQGAAYVFEREGASWSQVAYLKASNTDDKDEFGFDVDVDSDTVVVGARVEDSSAMGVDGDQLNNDVSGSGAVYVFRTDGVTWTQDAYIKASNTDLGDGFGETLSVCGETLAVGAQNERSDADGIGGDQSDNSALFAGAVYVFERQAGRWTQQAYIKASNSDAVDRFGSSLDLDGDTLIIGAYDEDSAASGVGGDELDNTATTTTGNYGAGAAYVFLRVDGAWSQQAYLKASNTDPGDQFGFSVGVSGDLAVVGALQEDSEGVGVNGDQLGTAGLSSLNIGSGAAYVFWRESGGHWSQLAYIKPANTYLSRFGGAVAIDGERLVIGEHSSQASGNCAYLFEDLPTQWLNLGQSLHGFFGVVLMTGEGELTPGSSNTIRIRNAVPLSPAIVLVGLDPVTPAPFKQGLLVPVPPILTLSLKTNTLGEIEIPFTWPTGLASGLRFTVQGAVADATTPAGASLSNAVTGISQ